MSEFRRDDTASWDAQEVRQAQGARREPTPAHHSKSRHRRRRRNSLAVLVGYLIFVLLASAILAGVGWMLGSDFCAFNRGALRETSVEVTAEDSVSTVADKLQDAGLIKYKWFFKLYAGISHADKKIGIGTYTLNTEMDYRALILGMHNSSGNLTAETVTVTIPEGYTVEQIIQLLAENDVSDAAALEEAAKNHVFDKFDFVDNENLGSISRLEGYLFPDTYEFYVKENADSALSRLLANFQDRIVDDPDLAPLIANSSYSLKEIVIMASLIEKETDGTDRTLISSVIHTRLENVGETAPLLQIDASLVYAAGREITEDDYQTLDSPYNLYTHQGLPPTAIANAGKASIQAALQPDDTNYYFYVLNPDTQRHVFSRTLSEHNANLRKFG